MSRGIALSVLVTQLKMELGDADESNTATDSRYKKLLANKQSDLANTYDWEFLIRQWDVSVVGGTRYVTFPSADIRGMAGIINFGRTAKVDVFYNNYYRCVEHGIGPAEYNWKNSDLDERIDPIQRWQTSTNVDDTANDNEFEVWPIPVTTQTMRFVGQRELRAFTADSDTCDLDHLLLIYGVAAEQLALRGQPNAPLVLRKFQERLLKIRAGMPSSEEPIVFGYRCKEDRRIAPVALAGGRPITSFSGTMALTNGATSGSVVYGTALSYTPTAANLTVTKPAGGFDIFATIVAGTLSATGFDFTLSAAPDTSTYVLNYIVTP